MEKEPTPEQLEGEASPTERIAGAIRSGDTEHLLQTLTTVNENLGCAELAHFQPGRGTTELKDLLKEFLEKAREYDSADVKIHLGDGMSRIVLNIMKLEGTRIDVDLSPNSSPKVKMRWARLHRQEDRPN